MTAIDVPPAVPTPAVKTSLLRRLVRRPVSLVSLIFLLVVVVIAIIGRAIAPFDPNLASLQLTLAEDEVARISELHQGEPGRRGANPNDFAGHQGA